MSGFNAGAIDPALLSGGPNNSLLSLNNETTGAADSHSTNSKPSGSASQFIFPTSSNAQSSASLSSPSLNQFSNLNSGHHGLNQPSNSSLPSQSRPAPSAFGANPELLNGAPPASNGNNFFLDGLPAKEYEMHQKDQELAQFLLKIMDEYKPIMPDEVAKYYLQKVGFECNDVKVQRLLVLACQKFVSDIAQDAFSYARTRTGQAPGGRQGTLAPNSNSAGLSNSLPNNPGAKKDRTRTVLTQEDLAQALAEYGINASRAPYYL